MVRDHRAALYTHWPPKAHRTSGPDSKNDSIRNLKDEQAKPRSDPLNLTPAYAVQIMQSRLPSKKKGYSEALYKKTAYYSAQDLPFHAFHILDKELFGDALAGNVLLRWEYLPHGCLGRTRRPGYGYPRTTIELSKDDLLRKGRSHKFILTVLVHQMIHACLLQYRGPQRIGDEKSEGCCDLTHGRSFSTVAYAVGDRFFDRLLPPKTSRRSPFRRGAVPRPEHSNPEYPNISYCYADFPMKDRNECNEWRNSYEKIFEAEDARFTAPRPSAGPTMPEPKSKEWYYFSSEKSDPKPVPRSANITPWQYVVLQFQGHAFPIPKHLLEKAPTLQRQLISRATTSIQVPSNNLDELRSVHSYLQYGDYAPRLNQLTLPPITNTPTTMPYGGPPVILPPRPDANPSFLALDLKVYNLAGAMGFSELRNHALKRLWQLPYTENDVAQALDYVYHEVLPSSSKQQESDNNQQMTTTTTSPISPPSSTKDIRTWVKALLKTQIPSYHGDWAKKYPTNLDVLRKAPAYKDKFIKLREKGTALITDVDAVERELADREKEKQMAMVGNNMLISNSSSSTTAIAPPHAPAVPAFASHHSGGGGGGYGTWASSPGMPMQLPSTSSSSSSSPYHSGDDRCYKDPYGHVWVRASGNMAYGENQQLPPAWQQPNPYAQQPGQMCSGMGTAGGGWR